MSQLTLWGHASRVPDRGWRGAVPPSTPRRSALRRGWLNNGQCPYIGLARGRCASPSKPLPPRRSQPGQFDRAVNPADGVGFQPEQRSLVQIEPSLDSDSWKEREARYFKKFEAGRKYIPGLFPGMAIPKHIDQIALFVYGGGKSRERIAGGRVVFIRDFMEDIRAGIQHRKVARAAIPQGLPLLRTLQFAADYWNKQETG